MRQGRYLATALASVLLNACDTELFENNNAATEQKCATSVIAYGLELPAATAGQNSLQFNYTDSNTYGPSTSTSFFDAGNSNDHSMKLYLLKSDALTWDAYFYADSSPVNIRDGSVGSFGQYKAQLIFDNAGKLLRTVPEQLQTQPMLIGSYPGQVIDLRFDTAKTISSSGPFTVSLLAPNGGC